MEIVSCKECGKLFNFIRGQRVCPACSRKLEDKFMSVRLTAGCVRRDWYFRMIHRSDFLARAVA